MQSDSRSFLTGIERRFSSDDIIVSKTTPTGIITYANDTFLHVSGYQECELLGKPHSIIRHPAMPRVIFHYLWKQISQGHEVFAYAINRCKNGDHYWVYAHVTPTVDADGAITGYHSSRRSPDRESVCKVEAVYQQLLAREKSATDLDQLLSDAYQFLGSFLQEQGLCYDEYVMTV